MTRLRLLCLASVIMITGCTSQQQDESPAAPTPPSAASGRGSGIGVDVCLSGGECRSLKPAVADQVRAALDLDTFGDPPSADENGAICRAGSAIYTVKIHYASGEPLEVAVPESCGPLTVNGEARPINESARDRVRLAYETAG